MSAPSFPTDVYQGLVKRGIPAPAALGAAAGVFAEANGGDHTAVNPTSGAVGLGQWVGDRQHRLVSAYDAKVPTRDQQIDYMAWEMKGGDPGMAAVTSAKDPVTAAQLYITKGMRPAPGQETTGDLQRAHQALSLVGVGARPIAQAPAASGDPFDPNADPDAALHNAQPGKLAPAGVSTDPFDPSTSGANGGTNAQGGPQLHPGGAAYQGGAGGNGTPGVTGGRVDAGDPSGNQGGQAGGQAGGLQPHQLGVIPGAIDAFGSGLTAGVIHPATAALNTILPLDKLTNPNVKSIWDSSLPDAFSNNLAIERGGHEQFQQDHPGIAIPAEIGGAIMSPLNKLFAPAEGAGFLRSVPNFMAQGATYGGLSGLSESGLKGAAIDAGLGAALGPAGALVGSGIGKLFGAIMRGRSTIANAVPQSVKQQVADLIDKGASADQIVDAVPQAKDWRYVQNWVDYRASGGKNPVSFEAPPAAAASPATATAAADDQAPIVVTGKKLAAALGTQGQRRGVESIADLPPQVADDVQRLTAAGVSPQEAQAEADIRYVGGKPTVANVTRDPVEQRAMFEGAKYATPEGAQLSDTIASNNQALHNTVTSTVDQLGGVPAQGEAAETAAQALAKASDSAKAGVNAKYAAARQTDGDVKINTDALREILQSPEMATPTNPQIKQLSQGILAHLQATDQRAGTTLRTPEEIEQIRQLANAAYDPMGGPVNGAVGKIGGALNDSLDQLDTASAAWKAARAAHRNWASQYSDPAGVAKLIARDASGNFVNGDQWRASENGLIDRLNDKPFTQVVGQLKQIGANDALDKLKAGIVQRAYERSTNSARDQMGNPSLNGKLFQNELNKIGMPKLKALFSNDELAHLATIGRAARSLNEAVPGAVNTSSTASSLAKALGTTASNHPLMKGAKYAAALTGHLPAAALVHGAEHLAGGSAKRAVQQGLREQLNPALARTVAATSASRIENAQARAAMGRVLRSRGAAPAANDDQRRELGRRLQNAL